MCIKIPRLSAYLGWALDLCAARLDDVRMTPECKYMNPQAFRITILGGPENEYLWPTEAGRDFGNRYLVIYEPGKGRTI